MADCIFVADGFRDGEYHFHCQRCGGLVSTSQDWLPMQVHRVCLEGTQTPSIVSKTATEIEVGVGTELKMLLKRLGIRVTGTCKCNQRVLIMNVEGPDWCHKNIWTIVDWMREEAENRKILFVNLGGWSLVRLAIHRARKKLKMLERAK